MADPTDPQQRFLAPRERMADDVYLALLNTADDYADGDLIVGNLNALHAAVMGVRDEELEQLRAEWDTLKAELADAKRDHDMTAEYVGKQLGFNQALPAVTSVGCAMALGEELAEARAATTGIRDALQTACRIMACSSRDWSLHADDVWLYALLVGWDCELPEHADGAHDEIDCSGTDRLEYFAERFGWTEGGIAKLRAQRKAIAALDAPQRPETTTTPARETA